MMFVEVCIVNLKGLFEDGEEVELGLEVEEEELSVSNIVSGLDGLVDGSCSTDTLVSLS